MLKITATQIQRQTVKFKFNPKEDRGMGVIASMEDPDFFILRAAEAIQTAKHHKDEKSQASCNKQLIIAGQLLALALAQMEA